MNANVTEVQIHYKTKVKASERRKITNSDTAANILRSIWSENIEYKEEMYLLLLNRQNAVLGYTKISEGGASGTFCDPKMIFQPALLAHASSIILSHNHPSGNKTPSQSDIELTKKIKQGGELLEIKLLDHIILTPESYYSLADEGNM